MRPKSVECGKTKTKLPVENGTLVIISKGANKYMNQIPGSTKIYGFRKIIIVCTPYILNRILSMH